MHTFYLTIECFEIFPSLLLKFKLQFLTLTTKHALRVHCHNFSLLIHHPELYSSFHRLTINFQFSFSVHIFCTSSASRAGFDHQGRKHFPIMSIMLPSREITLLNRSGSHKRKSKTNKIFLFLIYVLRGCRTRF